MNPNYSTAAVLLLCSMFVSPGLAQSDPSLAAGGAPATAPASAAVPPGASGNVLQGSVRGAVLRTEDGLKKIGETSASLQGSALHVMNEVNRKDTVAVRSPNYIGNGIVIPALPNVSGTMQIGRLPPREKFLNTFTNQTTYFVQLLQNEVDALMLPHDSSPEVEQLWARIRTGMEKVQSHLGQLRLLTVGPSYNTSKITREALAIYDRAKEIDKLRRQVAKLVKASVPR